MFKRNQLRFRKITVTIAPLKLSFTSEEFLKYCESIKLKDWKPTGVVIHNTAMPTLKMVQDYITSKKWTFEQLIDNWWVRYIKSGWSAGPHLFVMPDKIWVATPLTVKGTHSPSFNAKYYGIEIVGDYSTETFTPEHRATVLVAIQGLYKILGVKPTDANFKFHGEDTRTSHKLCPGKAIHPKSGWITELNSTKEK